MASIDTTLLIHAPIDRVLHIARDNRSFPDFMDDVKSLTVVQDEGDRVVSEWIGVISAFNVKVRWTQEDKWHGNRCDFVQLKGDYDSMSGYWEFKDEGQGHTRFTSHVDYEYNVPALGALVKKVIHSLATKNIEALMAAIKHRAEAN